MPENGEPVKVRRFKCGLTGKGSAV